MELSSSAHATEVLGVALRKNTFVETQASCVDSRFDADKAITNRSRDVLGDVFSRSASRAGRFRSASIKRTTSQKIVAQHVLGTRSAGAPRPRPEWSVLVCRKLCPAATGRTDGPFCSR